MRFLQPCEELEALKSRPEGGCGANGGTERSLSVALTCQRRTGRTQPDGKLNIGDLSERQFQEVVISITPRTEGTVQLSLKTDEKVEQGSHVPLKWQQLKLSGASNLDNEQLTVSFIPSVFVWFCSFAPFQHF